MIAMKKAREPIGEARDDYWIFSEITRRLGAADIYTEGRDEMQWLSHLYEEGRQKSAGMGVSLPPFEEFWEAGLAKVPGENTEPVMLAKFRADPAANPLKTPSGKIEIFSERIASFGYDDCPGHATWMEPVEWLGSRKAERYPLHMLSDQPVDKLHSGGRYRMTGIMSYMGDVGEDLFRLPSFTPKSLFGAPIAMENRPIFVGASTQGKITNIFVGTPKALASQADLQAFCAILAERLHGL